MLTLTQQNKLVETQAYNGLKCFDENTKHTVLTGIGMICTGTLMLVIKVSRIAIHSMILIWCRYKRRRTVVP